MCCGCTCRNAIIRNNVRWTEGLCCGLLIGTSRLPSSIHPLLLTGSRKRSGRCGAHGMQGLIPAMVEDPRCLPNISANTFSYAVKGRNS